jgi:hypothetical protein
MRVDPSSIPIAVRPSMMAWLVVVAMSPTLPGCQNPKGVEAERYRRTKGVLSVAVEACGCCLIGPEYFGRGESI